MKKSIAIIFAICFCIAAFSACRDEQYTFSETRDFSEYSPNFEFFPKSVDGAEVLNFGDCSYNYWSQSVDEFLVLKFDDQSSFEKELERIEGLKSKYDHLEKEEYLVDGYRCVFLMCSYSTEKEEGTDKYIRAWHNEAYYGMGWNLVMISESEMTVVYNLLEYDTRNFEKWGERKAHIADYFGLDLEAMAKELSLSGEK